MIWNLDGFYGLQRRRKNLSCCEKKWRHLFCGKKGSAKLGWSRVAEELPFDGNWAYLQKKWQNLMHKYKELRMAECRAVDAGIKSPITWQFYEIMKRVNGGGNALPAPHLLFDSALEQRASEDPPPPPSPPQLLRASLSRPPVAVPHDPPPSPKALVSVLRKPTQPYPTAIYATPKPSPTAAVLGSTRPASFIIISKPPASALPVAHRPVAAEVAGGAPGGVVSSSPTPPITHSSSQSLPSVKEEALLSSSSIPPATSSSLPQTSHLASPLDVPGISPSVLWRKRKREVERAEEDFFKYMKAREAEHTALMRTALQILGEIRDEIKMEKKT